MLIKRNTAMNANKRIEEFILKLSIRQNDPGLLNIINEIKISSHFDYPVISDKTFNNKYDNKSSCITEKD
jgi:hypothetical protein